jgi:uncharacterized protein (DUF433 family)
VVEPSNIVRGFSEEQTANLTGLTVHRLRNWDRTGFFEPSFKADKRRTPYSRIYSFKDLLSLQILKALRLDLGCSLQHLREVKRKLAELGIDEWPKTTLYVLNKRVMLHDESKGELREAVSGQIVFQIPLGVVRGNMETRVSDLNKRRAEDIGRIDQKRNINHNAAVVAGTRIPVGAVKRLSEDGFTVPQILAEYPSLTEADVKEALRYSKETRAA